MSGEIIYTRPDGTKVAIVATFHCDYQGKYWSISVSTCQPKKRTWTNVHSTDDYTWRKLGPKEREAYIAKKQFEVCTPDEIMSVMLKTWESLKPE